MPLDSGDSSLSEAKKLVMGLQSEDRKMRKQSLINLQNFITSNCDNFNDQDYLNFFMETHLYTLNCFRDKSEAVREQAIKYTSFLLIEKLPLNDYYLTYIFPIIVERIGSPEIIEESEELRLELAKFLQLVILKYSKTEQLKQFLNDCIIILQQSIKDKHPAIKEISCDCVINLAEALPRDFHMQAENLVKPLITCLGHQRFKVRMKAIQAIGEVVMHSSYNALNDTVGPLAEKLFDQIAIVRRTVAQVAGRWLLEYRDRYSFFHKILPLLLTGLNDEVEETRLESLKLWEQVGLQYQQENEKDLKDQLDFCLAPPKYYPTHLKRPNLGCRILVQRNISKLAKALAYELTSWQPDVRFRCSQLLCSLTLHAEADITQNLQDLLTAMYSTARDEDSRVVLNIIQAAVYIGTFTRVESWCKLILPAIENGVTPGNLLVLAALIKGAPKEYCSNHLETITEILSDDSVCVTRKPKVQIELFNCVKNIMEKYSAINDSSKVGYHLFKIIITLIALRDPDCNQYDINLLDDLYKTLELPDRYSLWHNYLERLLNHVGKDPQSWTIISAQRCNFEIILLHSNEAFGENLDIIKNILREALHEDADPESKLKIFWALSEAFGKKEILFFKTQKHVEQFLFDLITDIFVPSLVWKAGRTAESIRTMALSCLLSALNTTSSVDLLFPNAEILSELLDKLLPLLISLLEDASYHTRMISIEVIAVLKKHASDKKVWNLDDFIKIYPELLKRLDDPTDKVRLTAFQVLPEIFTEPPEDFRLTNFRAHHELIVDTLLTHFDDDDALIQDLAFSGVKVIARINLEVVKNKTERFKPLLRNSKGADEILDYLNQLKIE